MTHAAEPSPSAAGADIVRRAEPVDVPIQWQANGTARVAPRVNLEFVLWSQREGMRPEEIVRRLPALALADVYAVIAYALRHPEEWRTISAARGKWRSAPAPSWTPSTPTGRSALRGSAPATPRCSRSGGRPECSGSRTAGLA